jgi:hypothetical protein
VEINEEQIWILSQLVTGKVQQLSDFHGLLDEEDPANHAKELAYYIH